MEEAGKVNHYVCKSCEQPTITVNAHQGVTPFMIQCRATEGCHGDAVSKGYRVPQLSALATHEWYRPTGR